MSRIFRRLASSTSGSSAVEAAGEILQRYGQKPISIREQLIDANQVQLLSLTLGRQSLHESVHLTDDGTPVDGTPLPPGYHWGYFTPRYLDQNLGIDGTDTPLNPLAPWTRRMWGGSELEWKQGPGQLLRVGQTVTETTRITSAEAKTMRDGNSMILAGLEKTFETDNGVALIDKRQWVFRKELSESKAPPPTPEEKSLPEGEHIRDVVQTDVSLFRYSALTFNAHKIHYSRDWCRNVEGHRDCVVHGPLGLIGILDLYRDVNAGTKPESVPKGMTYRAMSPLYVGEKYRIQVDRDSATQEGRGRWQARITDSFGTTCAKGTITE